jgi:gamma-glutamyl-gamma-aminobutyrate hydrolase PuuD
VEGVVGTEGGWVCGVQWHPERGEAHGPGADERDPDRRLFWAFVQAAREFAAESAAAVSVGGD